MAYNIKDAETLHASQAIRPEGPVSSLCEYRFDSQSDAQTAIAAILATEYDRLLRLAWSIVRRVDGDAENVLGQATLRLLEHWQDVESSEHCQKLAYVTVRNLALDVCRIAKRTVVADDTTCSPTECTEDRAKFWANDEMLAWLLAQCDETEQRILRIWLLPGNGTYPAVVRETAGWLEPWTENDLKRFFKSLKDRVGVSLASPQALRFTSVQRSAHGQHDSYSLWSTLQAMDASTRAWPIVEDEYKARAPKAHYVRRWFQTWDPHGTWESTWERVPV